MKKIDFPVFGEGEYLYLNIERLIEIEKLTGKPAGDLLTNQSLDLGLMTVILSVALRHHKMRTPQWYAQKLQEHLDNDDDFRIEFDVQTPLVKCIVGSGILGKQAYYQIFPEELTEKAKKDIEKERKN